jgi:uncharacterized protein with von Willebrand factor type A (vWA) domain
MYTGVFLRFIHGVLDEFREAEAFLFHTRLAHVSDAMKERDAFRALDRLSVMAQGAGGGTKIGESLQTFNRWHAARVIHSRTCVMIVSDGYETGDARCSAARWRRWRGAAAASSGSTRWRDGRAMRRRPPASRRRCRMSISMRRPIRCKACPRSNLISREC